MPVWASSSRRCSGSVSSCGADSGRTIVAGWRSNVSTAECAAVVGGDLADVADHGLVAEVHAVVGADRDHGSFAGPRGLGQIGDDAHGGDATRQPVSGARRTVWPRARGTARTPRAACRARRTRPTVRRPATPRAPGRWPPAAATSSPTVTAGERSHGGRDRQQRAHVGWRRFVDRERPDRRRGAGRAGALRRRAGDRDRRRASGCTCPTSTRRRCASTPGAGPSEHVEAEHRDRARLRARPRCPRAPARAAAGRRP